MRPRANEMRQSSFIQEVPKGINRPRAINGIVTYKIFNQLLIYTSWCYNFRSKALNYTPLNNFLARLRNIRTNRKRVLLSIFPGDFLIRLQ